MDNVAGRASSFDAIVNVIAALSSFALLHPTSGRVAGPPSLCYATVVFILNGTYSLRNDIFVLRSRHSGGFYFVLTECDRAAARRGCGKIAGRL